MTIKTLLIANRGEIAIRIARAAAEMGIRSIGVYSEDDSRSLHVRRVDKSVALSGSGAAPYLDIGQMIAVAREESCDAVHPGYGFLSENAAFGRACADSGLIFVGPRPELLELFGDKVAARALADRCGVPIPKGTAGPTSLDQARDFLATLGPGGAIMIKAVAGGGGRGMRMAFSVGELEKGYDRCRSEAKSAFGRDDVYVEQIVPDARHIEVQVVGDHEGNIVHLGERECSIQRRYQKLMEIAPSPTLSQSARDALTSAALAIAREAQYAGLGTFEFLAPSGREDRGGRDPRSNRNPLCESRRSERLRHPAPDQHGDHARRRLYSSVHRGDQGLRAAIGAWCARRWLWLRRLHTQSEIRLAPGETDRPFTDSRLPRRHSAGPARAQRIPYRGIGHQYRLPEGGAGPSRRGVESCQHPVSRRPCGCVRRGGGGQTGGNDFRSNRGFGRVDGAVASLSRGCDRRAGADDRRRGRDRCGGWGGGA